MNVWQTLKLLLDQINLRLNVLETEERLYRAVEQDWRRRQAEQLKRMEQTGLAH